MALNIADLFEHAVDVMPDRAALLVNDRFVLIQIGVEGSTVEQAQQLAAAAASRIA